MTSMKTEKQPFKSCIQSLTLKSQWFHMIYNMAQYCVQCPQDASTPNIIWASTSSWMVWDGVYFTASQRISTRSRSEEHEGVCVIYTRRALFSIRRNSGPAALAQGQIPSQRNSSWCSLAGLKDIWPPSSRSLFLSNCLLMQHQRQHHRLWGRENTLYPTSWYIPALQQQK